MASDASTIQVAIGIPALQIAAPHLRVALRRLVTVQNVPASRLLVAVDNITRPISEAVHEHEVAVFEAGCAETRYLVCKTAALLRRLYSHAPTADWHVRLSIDCFLIYPHLLSALAVYNPSNRVYAGCARRMASTTAEQFKGRHVPAQLRTIPHAAGGPLFAMSRPLARWFSQHWRLYYNPERGEQSGLSDDVGLGAFLGLVGKTPVTDLPGVFQLPPRGAQEQEGHEWLKRFKAMRDCPCPLPPPVHHYLWRGSDMRIAPVVPLEWPSIVALHAHVSTWHAWEYLERQRAALASDGRGELLVYLELPPDGSRRYYPSTLTVCRLNASRDVRLASWQNAC